GTVGARRRQAGAASGACGEDGSPATAPTRDACGSGAWQRRIRAGRRSHLRRRARAPGRRVGAGRGRPGGCGRRAATTFFLLLPSRERSVACSAHRAPRSAQGGDGEASGSSMDARGGRNRRGTRRELVGKAAVRGGKEGPARLRAGETTDVPANPRARAGPRETRRRGEGPARRTRAFHPRAGPRATRRRWQGPARWMWPASCNHLLSSTSVQGEEHGLLCPPRASICARRRWRGQWKLDGRARRPKSTGNTA
ncbi:hypothetical protein BS78_07G172000, partial [Paspalum vaginatum]